MKMTISAHRLGAVARKVAAWVAKRRAAGDGSVVTPHDVAVRFGLGMHAAAAALERVDDKVNKEAMRAQRDAEAGCAQAEELRAILARLQAAAVARAAAAQGPRVVRNRGGVVAQVSAMEAIADATRLEQEAMLHFEALVAQAVGKVLAAVDNGELVVAPSGQLVRGPRRTEVERQ